MTAPFFGWKVVWGAFGVAVFAWGVGFYGLSAYLHWLHQARGWSVSAISAAITCHFLFSAGIVAHLPAIHRRFGLAAATRAGGVLAGLGAVAWAAAPSIWMLFPAALISGTGWALTSGAAINAMVAPWFDANRPIALSMAFNGASVGGVVFAPLWALLIGGLGMVAAAAAIAAVMAGTVWWIAGAFLRSTPAALGQHPDGSTVAVDPGTPRGASSRASLAPGFGIWRDDRFITLSVAFALGLFAQIGLIAHLFSLLSPALNDIGAGAAISLVTASAVVGRTVLGKLLSARSDRRLAAALNFMVQVAGCAMLVAADGTTAPLVLAGCVLFGFGVGNMTSLPPLIAQAEFSSADVARVVPAVTAVNQAVFAFAPGALGLAREISSWGGTPLVLAMTIQLVATLVVLAGRRRASSA